MRNLLHSINGIGQQQSPYGGGGFCRLHFVVEVPAVATLPIDLDRCSPFLEPLVPRHTSESRRAAALSTRVLRVAATRDHAKIAPAVVEPVAVNVVRNQSIAVSESQKFTVQTDLPPAPVSVNHAIPTRVSAGQVPSPLPNDGQIVGVYQGIGTNRPVHPRKRDAKRPIRLIHWGGHRQIARLGAGASLQRAVIRHGERFAARAAGQFDAITEAVREAPSSAEPGSSSRDSVLCGEEFLAALLADTQDGTLTGHWEASLPGVAPPDVDASRGYSRCTNFTTRDAVSVICFGTLS